MKISNNLLVITILQGASIRVIVISQVYEYILIQYDFIMYLNYGLHIKIHGHMAIA